MNITASPNERLNMREAAMYLDIPYTLFENEVEEGKWDGTFVLHGTDKRFIARMLDKRNDEIAEKTGEAAQQARQRRRAA